MEKAVERGPDWAGLPVIATVVRLLSPHATEHLPVTPSRRVARVGGTRGWLHGRLTRIHRRAEPPFWVGQYWMPVDTRAYKGETPLSHSPCQGRPDRAFELLSPRRQVSLVAGAVFVPDANSQRLPLVAARWVYVPVKQGAREMQRIGLAA